MPDPSLGRGAAASSRPSRASGASGAGGRASSYTNCSRLACRYLEPRRCSQAAQTLHPSTLRALRASSCMFQLSSAAQGSQQPASSIVQCASSSQHYRRPRQIPSSQARAGRALSTPIPDKHPQPEQSPAYASPSPQQTTTQAPTQAPVQLLHSSLPGAGQPQVEQGDWSEPGAGRWADHFFFRGGLLCKSILVRHVGKNEREEVTHSQVSHWLAELRPLARSLRRRRPRAERVSILMILVLIRLAGD